MVAFQSLVTAYQERLYYLIRKMVQSHEDSQDLLQEVFIRALTKIDRLREPEKFNSWIYNIAVNMVIDFKRRQHWNGRVSLDGDIPPEMISDKLVDKKEVGPKNNGFFEKELRSELDRALLKLPINHREAFLLFHYHKLPVKTIGEYMDCPESTVRSYIFRAIKKLRVYLKDYHESIKE